MLNAWQAKQLLDGRTKFNLGPYRIIDSIGQGGMGQVFKAQHAKLGRIVAVKVLPRDKSTPEAIANFTREIRALSSLDHPKLVARARRRRRRKRPLSSDGVRAWHGPAEAGPPRGAAGHVGRRFDHLPSGRGPGICPRPRDHPSRREAGNVLVAPDGQAKLSDLGLAGPLAGAARDRPALRQDRGNGRLSLARPGPQPAEPHAGLGHLLAGLHALLRGDRQGAFSRRHDGGQGPGALRVAAAWTRAGLNPRLTADFVEVMADMMAKDPVQRIASAREVIARLMPFVSRPEESVAPTVAAAASPPPVGGAARRVMPPPIAGTPPLVRRPRRPALVTGLADTSTDLFGLPVAVIEPNGAEVSAPMIESARGFDDDDSPSVEIPLSVERDLMAVLWPLTVFVLAPLALVGAIGLLWLLVRTAMQY